MIKHLTNVLKHLVLSNSSILSLSRLFCISQRIQQFCSLHLSRISQLSILPFVHYIRFYQKLPPLFLHLDSLVNVTNVPDLDFGTLLNSLFSNAFEHTIIQDVVTDTQNPSTLEWTSKVCLSLQNLPFYPLPHHSHLLLIGSDQSNLSDFDSLSSPSVSTLSLHGKVNSSLIEKLSIFQNLNHLTLSVNSICDLNHLSLVTFNGHVEDFSLVPNTIKKLSISTAFTVFNFDDLNRFYSICSLCLFLPLDCLMTGPSAPFIIDSLKFVGSNVVINPKESIIVRESLSISGTFDYQSLIIDYSTVLSFHLSNLTISPNLINSINNNCKFLKYLELRSILLVDFCSHDFKQKLNNLEVFKPHLRIKTSKNDFNCACKHRCICRNNLKRLLTRIRLKNK
ncbi:hypothetical protein P9112_011344 [Eukaryota sp. TZLM1-RC]